MSSVFISYAKEDAAVARMLADALQSAGFSVWWDRHIPPGKTWDDVIGRALDTATCVIVLWSGTSVQSRWVREEAERAVSRDCLIPVLVEKVDLPFGFGRIQAADLSGWRGDEHAPEFSDLVRAVSDLVQTTPDRSVADQGVSERVKPAPEPHKRQSKLFWIAAGMIAVAVASYLVSTYLRAPHAVLPNVVGLPSSEAQHLLRSKGFANINIIEESTVSSGHEPGTVVKQDPVAGRSLPIESSVRLVLATRPAPEPQNWIRLVHKGLYVAKFYLKWEGQTKQWQSGDRAVGYKAKVNLPPNVKTVLLNAQAFSGFRWKTILRKDVPALRTYTVTGTALNPKCSASP